MPICVKPKGWWPGEKRTRLSIDAHLMKGDYDDYLHFPFCGDLIIEVFNWREDKEHITGTFSLQDTTTMGNACERVQNREINPIGLWLPYNHSPSYSSLPYNHSSNTEYIFTTA